MYSTKNIFRKQRYRISYESFNNLRNFFKNRSKPTKKFNKQEQYINAHAITATSILTWRTLEQRFKEHLPSNTTSTINKQKSNCTDHIIKENHICADIETNLSRLHDALKKERILKKEDKIFTINWLKNNADSLRSDELDFVFNDHLYDTITILNTNKKKILDSAKLQ